MAYFNFFFFGQLLNWESKLEKRSCPCLKGSTLSPQIWARSAGYMLMLSVALERKTGINITL